MAVYRRIQKRILGNCLSRSSGEYLSSSLSSSLRPPFSLILQRGIASRLFVAGLSFSTTDKALQEAFSQYGQVVEANIIMDRVSERSKGFGFVTYASEDEAEKAIREMNGKLLHGRVIHVDLAKPQSLRVGGSGGVPIARGPPEPATEQQ